MSNAQKWATSLLSVGALSCLALCGVFLHRIHQLEHPPIVRSVTASEPMNDMENRARANAFGGDGGWVNYSAIRRDLELDKAAQKPRKHKEYTITAINAADTNRVFTSVDGVNYHLKPGESVRFYYDPRNHNWTVGPNEPMYLPNLPKHTWTIQNSPDYGAVACMDTAYKVCTNPPQLPNPPKRPDGLDTPAQMPNIVCYDSDASKCITTYTKAPQ